MILARTACSPRRSLAKPGRAVRWEAELSPDARAARPYLSTLRLHEILQNLLHLFQVQQIDIHHVTGVKLGIGDVRAVNRVERHVVERSNAPCQWDRPDHSARREQGCACKDFGSSWRPAFHRHWRSCCGRRNSTAAPRRKFRRVNRPRISIRCGCRLFIAAENGPRTAASDGSKSGSWRGIIVAPGDARIVGAENQTLVMQQLLAENTAVNPQMVVFNHLR